MLLTKTTNAAESFSSKARRRIDAILVAAFAISSIQPEGRALWGVGDVGRDPETWPGD